MKNNQAFSLIELSIVLVILGLLVGGITAGASLIKSAELRSVISEVDEIKTNVNAFRAQYNALPGDISDASDYWGTAACNSADASEMDGNADGRIDFNDNVDAVIESYKAWCHLTLSGLASGVYDGSVEAIATVPTINNDIPASKMLASGYFIGYGVGGLANTNSLVLGRPANGTYADDNLSANGTMDVADAKSIDTKIDDGDAAAGQIVAFEGDDATANACLGAGGEYNLTGANAAEEACGLTFNLGV